MTTRPLLGLIAAVATNGAIGRDNQLLFRLPDDLKRFKRLTTGHPVIMGRRTWESLPARNRPLPGRLNIVVTRNLAWRDEGAAVVHDLPQALHLAQGHEQAFVIGGVELFAAALPMVDVLELTEVHREAEGDVYFPAWDRAEFEETLREPHEHEGLAYDFVTYRRRIQRPQANAQ